jgi:multicomponent Na+:H+ antiporter subunit B
MVLFAVGALGLGILLGLAFFGMPAFGGSHHPYRDLAIPVAVAHGTANAVSSVNFDQRGLDTLGEETILLGSVLGAAALLRPGRDERERPPPGRGQVLPVVQLAALLMLPLTLVIGVDVVAHGHVTPGGGFQGGVVLATGLHLLYLGGRYPSLERLRPLNAFELGEAIGAAAFAVVGIAGIVASAAFLANFLPFGEFGQLFSAGTVPVLNLVVGLEVGSGIVVLLARFLEQAITIQPSPGEMGEQGLGGA